LGYGPLQKSLNIPGKLNDIARQPIALARKQSINLNFGADTVLISTDLYISLAH